MIHFLTNQKSLDEPWEKGLALLVTGQVESLLILVFMWNTEWKNFKEHKIGPMPLKSSAVIHFYESRSFTLFKMYLLKLQTKILWSKEHTFRLKKK